MSDTPPIDTPPPVPPSNAVGVTPDAPAAPPAPPPPAPQQAVPPDQPVAVAAKPVAPDEVPGLSEEDRMWAAATHASAIVGFGGIVPVIVWALYQDPEKSAFVRFHAKQAAIVQIVSIVVIIIISLVTCGAGSILIMPWMAFEGWMAWLAYQGKRSGYPMVGDFTE